MSRSTQSQRQNQPTGKSGSDKKPTEPCESLNPSTSQPDAKRQAADGKCPDRPDPMVEKNVVDEASWESFPASDPPAFNAGPSD